MDGQSQIYLPKLTFVNKIIVIICASIFILDLILTQSLHFSLAEILGVSANHVLNGHVYSMFTYVFYNHSIMEVVLNSLMLWLMGSEFESNWGTSRYIKFLLTVILGGALFYLIISFIFFKNSIIFAFPLTGLNGLVAALCVAYAVIYPTRIFSFLMIIPIQAKYFCWILVAIALFQGISTPSMVGSWGQLGGSIFGFLFMAIVSNRNFKLLSEKMSSLAQFSAKRKSNAKLRIVKNEDDKPPKYWQ